MALRVPTVQGPQVEARPLQGGFQRSSASPELLGAGGRQMEQVGQAAMGLGNQMARLQEQQRNELAEAAAKDADTQFAQAVTEQLYHPERGYMVRQGRAAAESYDSTVKEIDTIRRKTLESVTDPKARELASRAFDQRAQVAVQTAARHAGSEGQKWKIQSSASRAETSLLTAASDPENAESFNGGLQAAFSEAEAQGQLQGWDAETTELQKRKYADFAYERRYSAWANKDPVAALRHFSQHGKAMTPLQREQTANKLFHAAAPVLADQLNDLGGVGVVPPAPAVNGKPGEPAPRGVRNNNPGNIVKTDEAWQGEVLGNDPRYASFDTPEAGIRAMAKTLTTYGEKHGLTSVQGIVARWAPASENDTVAYVKTVAKELGVKPDQPLNLKDPAVMGGLVRSIIKHENGQQPYSDEQIAKGISGSAGDGQAATRAPAVMREPGGLTGHDVIDALPPQQRLQVIQMARTRGAQAMSDARQVVSQRLQDSTAEYMERGMATNPPTAAELIRAYGQNEGLRRHQDLQDTATVGRQIQQVRSMPLTQIEQLLEQAKPEPGDGFAERQKNYDALVRASKHVVDARKKDPVAYALQTGEFGISPLKAPSLGALAAEMPKRAAAAERISSSYGTPVALFTDQEADVVGKMLAGQPAKDRAIAIAGMSQGMSAAQMRAFAKQMGGKDDTLGAAVILTAQNAKTSSGRLVSELLLAGADGMKEQRIKWPAGMDQVSVRAEIDKLTRGAFQSENGQRAAGDAALSVFAGMLAEGQNPDVKQAVRLATGGIMDMNGQKLVKPYGWSDDMVRKSLRDYDETRVAQLTGGPVQLGDKQMQPGELARLMPGAQLGPSKVPGAYTISFGGRMVMGRDGRPLMVPLEQR